MYAGKKKHSTLSERRRNKDTKCCLLGILAIILISVAIGGILSIVYRARSTATPTELNPDNRETIIFTIDPEDEKDAVNDILNNPDMLIPGFAQAAGIIEKVITEMTTTMGIEMTMETNYKDAAQLGKNDFKRMLENNVKKIMVDQLNISSARFMTTFEKKESRTIKLIIKIIGSNRGEATNEECARYLKAYVKKGHFNLPGYNALYNTRIKRDTNAWKNINTRKVLLVFISIDPNFLQYEDLIETLTAKINDKTMTLGTEIAKMTIVALSLGRIKITEVKEIKGCHHQTCQNQGVCRNEVEETYKCTCKDGYTGKKCETDIDECASFPCQNGATCFDHTSGFKCTCLKGWNGVQCANNIKECASSPCENGGTCTDDVNEYICTCMNGWQGSQCNININECASLPCKHDGVCTDHVNGYTCTCLNGWQGRNCGINIDECASNLCQNDATCNDLINDYNCKCAPGWEGVHCENNIDECASNPCQNDATCNDLINEYNCTCASEWEGVYCENNTNECASSPCLNDGTCIDMVDAYNCTCAPGWEGDHCQNNTDECASSQCQNGATCNDFVNEYNCTCAPGWEGVHCEYRSLPFKCSFDTADLCGFIQVTTDQFDWTRHDSSTPSNDTGPAAAIDGSFYLYAQSSTRVQGELALIKTPTLNFDGTACISFWYHMYGSDMGSLYVYKEGSDGQQDIMSEAGNQENTWNFYSGNISLQTGNLIVFNASSGNGPKGDLAMDHFKIQPGICPALPPGTLLATCDTGLSGLYDVTEDNTGHLLVSGKEGLRNCSLSGGSAEVILGPVELGILSAVQTSTGELWVTGRANLDLYKRVQNGSWQAVNNDLDLFKLRLDQYQNLVAINTNNNIYKFNITSDIIIDTIISNNFIIGGLYLLNVSSILIYRPSDHCVQLLHWDGSPSTVTYGTCGQLGSTDGFLLLPQGLAVDKQGRVIIANMEIKGFLPRLSLFDIHGYFITTFLKGHFEYANSILITQNNLLIVGEPTGLVKIFKYLD